MILDKQPAADLTISNIASDTVAKQTSCAVLAWKLHTTHSSHFHKHQSRRTHLRQLLKQFLSATYMLMH